MDEQSRLKTPTCPSDAEDDQAVGSEPCCSSEVWGAYNDLSQSMLPSTITSTQNVI